MSNNITLIGMPGSGKSTYGVILAKRLGYNFLDTDLVIQEKYGNLLCEMIAKRGSVGFIEIEEEVNSEVSVNKTVIAPGGSAVYGSKAMEHFKSIGKVVYLKQPLETIRNNVGDITGRGVVMLNASNLDELYAERTPLYEKYADFTIDCDGKSGKEIVSEIYEIFK